jgi:TonB family protein
MPTHPLLSKLARFDRTLERRGIRVMKLSASRKHSVIASLVCVLMWPVTSAAQSKSSPQLLADLKSKDASARRQAASQLGSARARDSVRALTGALTDADVSVREAAAFALGQIADPAATDGLMRLLADKDAEVRATAAFALGMIGDRRAIKSLSDALTDADAAVRSGAVTALGLMQDEDAVDELIAMLDDPSFDVRYDAVWALGQIGEPDAYDHLQAAIVSIESLRASDALREAFRQAAQYSLANLRTADKGAPTRPRRATGIVDNTPYAKPSRPASIREVGLPAATDRALRAKVAGAVGLKILVGADGRAARAYVTRRLGYGLDQRAVQAILQYRFDPALQSGLPQTTWMEMEVRF